MQYRGQLNFYHWLAVSLILHASIVLSFGFSLFHTPHKTRQNKLVVELYGMIADRQQEEKKAGALEKKVTPRVPVMPHEAKKADPKQSVEKEKTLQTESPVHEEKMDGRKDQTEEASGPTQASAVFIPAVSGSAGDGMQQRQLSIGRGDQDTDKTKAYMARLSKRLQAHLVYPEETRKHGVEGVSTIRFTITESGGIKGDSLRLLKSSGYAALDSNALKSALASEPFEKPPRELTVAIAVEFTVEMVRSRTNRVSVR
jgi:periplasmic protein TonB